MTDLRTATQRLPDEVIAAARDRMRDLQMAELMDLEVRWARFTPHPAARWVPRMVLFSARLAILRTLRIPQALQAADPAREADVA